MTTNQFLRSPQPPPHLYPFGPFRFKPVDNEGVFPWPDWPSGPGRSNQAVLAQPSGSPTCAFPEEAMAQSLGFVACFAWLGLLAEEGLVCWTQEKYFKDEKLKNFMNQCAAYPYCFQRPLQR